MTIAERGPAWYDNLRDYEKLMKYFLAGFLSTCIFIGGLSSCVSNESNNKNVKDTAVRTSSDTAIIPGTPGPSGSQPSSRDTTQAYRDSLKREVHISDSSARSGTKP